MTTASRVMRQKTVTSTRTPRSGYGIQVSACVQHIVAAASIVGLVPVIGWIVLIVFMVQEGKPNRYDVTAARA